MLHFEQERESEEKDAGFIYLFFLIFFLFLFLFLFSLCESAFLLFNSPRRRQPKTTIQTVSIRVSFEINFLFLYLVCRGSTVHSISDQSSSLTFITSLSPLIRRTGRGPTCSACIILLSQTFKIILFKMNLFIFCCKMIFELSISIKINGLKYIFWN